MFNPYLERFEQLSEEKFQSFASRRDLVKHYSWAVPNKEAIEYLVSLSPIVELGAGTGYWAKVIQEAGGIIYAFDEKPYNNHWCDNQWTEILLMDSVDEVVKGLDYTLFLCWPPYDNPFAYQCLKTYTGNNFVYVGESSGGCTGDDDFHNLLNEEWEEDKIINIPQFWGINDYLISYTRKQ